MNGKKCKMIYLLCTIAVVAMGLIGCGKKQTFDASKIDETQISEIELYYECDEDTYKNVKIDFDEEIKNTKLYGEEMQEWEDAFVPNDDFKVFIKENILADEETYKHKTNASSEEQKIVWQIKVRVGEERYSLTGFEGEERPDYWAELLQYAEETKSQETEETLEEGYVRKYKLEFAVPEKLAETEAEDGAVAMWKYEDVSGAYVLTYSIDAEQETTEFFDRSDEEIVTMLSDVFVLSGMNVTDQEVFLSEQFEIDGFPARKLGVSMSMTEYSFDEVTILYMVDLGDEVHTLTYIAGIDTSAFSGYAGLYMGDFEKSMESVTLTSYVEKEENLVQPVATEPLEVQKEELSFTIPAGYVVEEDGWSFPEIAGGPSVQYMKDESYDSYDSMTMEMMLSEFKEQYAHVESGAKITEIKEEYFTVDGYRAKELGIKVEVLDVEMYTLTYLIKVDERTTHALMFFCGVYGETEEDFWPECEAFFDEIRASVSMKVLPDEGLELETESTTEEASTTEEEIQDILSDEELFGEEEKNAINIGEMPLKFDAPEGFILKEAAGYGKYSSDSYFSNIWCTAEVANINLDAFDADLVMEMVKNSEEDSEMDIELLSEESVAFQDYSGNCYTLLYESGGHEIIHWVYIVDVKEYLICLNYVLATEDDLLEEFQTSMESIRVE